MRNDEAADWLRQLSDELDRVAERLGDGNATREDIDRLLDEMVELQHMIFGRPPRAKRGQGARQKILAHMQLHVGEEVTGEELRRVAGIQEWARRVRELRVEHGYDITELGGSRYRLERPEPNDERANQWRLANGIRNRGGSARDRIGEFLTATVGEVVTRHQIDYVGDIKEGIRRVRELRDEHGWPINSHIDEPDLKPGEYRLVSADPADRRDPRQRLYPEGLRERIFARDNYTCRRCGRNREKAIAAGDTRFYLEVHHLHAVADELDQLPPDRLNDPENLITLCHRDHLEETATLHEHRRSERRNR